MALKCSFVGTDGVKYQMETRKLFSGNRFSPKSLDAKPPKVRFLLLSGQLANAAVAAAVAVVVAAVAVVVAAALISKQVARCLD